MSVLNRDADVAVRWSDAERTRALKRIIPRAAITKVLRKTGHGLRKCRRLPRWFVVWFVITLGLFCPDSYRQVFRWLHRFKKGGTPGRSTLCEARHSIGVAPLRMLADEVIELQGQPETTHAFYGGMRLMAMDSFVVNLFDSPANERAFGRPGGGRSPGAFPQARVLSLCELGTHVLWKSLIKPHYRGEPPMARYLVRFLQENMLLLWDRNFLSYDLVRDVCQRGAQILARLKSHMIFVPTKRLPDGSFLAKLYPSPRHRAKDRDGRVVRIIEYTFDDPQRAGAGEKHRLLTTLLSAREHPAKRLIELYHERWEEELVIDELKTHQREKRVLRSETPGGVVQEIYGLLLGHYVIRKLMCEAADFAGIAPRELSFVNTLKILRCRLPECPRSERGIERWFHDLVQEVAEERLETRRNRVNPRVVKTKMSKWAKKREKHRDFPQPTKTFRRSIVMID
jgi:Insertion element 4 transposase N-terminal/Transposase DDE domain